MSQWDDIRQQARAQRTAVLETGPESPDLEVELRQ